MLSGHPRRSCPPFLLHPCPERRHSITLQTCTPSDEVALHPRGSSCAYRRQHVSAFSPARLEATLPEPTSDSCLPKSKPSLWSLPDTGPHSMHAVLRVCTSTLLCHRAVHQILLLRSPVWVPGSSCLDLLFSGFQSWKGQRLLVVQCQLQSVNTEKRVHK